MSRIRFLERRDISKDGKPRTYNLLHNLDDDFLLKMDSVSATRILLKSIYSNAIQSLHKNLFSNISNYLKQPTCGFVHLLLVNSSLSDPDRIHLINNLVNYLSPGCLEVGSIITKVSLECHNDSFSSILFSISHELQRKFQESFLSHQRNRSRKLKIDLGLNSDSNLSSIMTIQRLFQLLSQNSSTNLAPTSIPRKLVIVLDFLERIETETLERLIASLTEAHFDFEISIVAFNSATCPLPLRLDRRTQALVQTDLLSTAHLWEMHDLYLRRLLLYSCSNVSFSSVLFLGSLLPIKTTSSPSSPPSLSSISTTSPTNKHSPALSSSVLWALRETYWRSGGCTYSLSNRLDSLYSSLYLSSPLSMLLATTTNDIPLGSGDPSSSSSSSPSLTSIQRNFLHRYRSLFPSHIPLTLHPSSSSSSSTTSSTSSSLSSLSSTLLSLLLPCFQFDIEGKMIPGGSGERGEEVKVKGKGNKKEKQKKSTQREEDSITSLLTHISVPLTLCGLLLSQSSLLTLQQTWTKALLVCRDLLLPPDLRRQFPTDGLLSVLSSASETMNLCSTTEQVDTTVLPTPLSDLLSSLEREAPSAPLSLLLKSLQNIQSNLTSSQHLLEERSADFKADSLIRSLIEEVLSEPLSSLPLTQTRSLLTRLVLLFADCHQSSLSLLSSFSSGLEELCFCLEEILSSLELVPGGGQPKKRQQHSPRTNSKKGPSMSLITLKRQLSLQTKKELAAANRNAPILPPPPESTSPPFLSSVQTETESSPLDSIDEEEPESDLPLSSIVPFLTHTFTDVFEFLTTSTRLLLVEREKQAQGMVQSWEDLVRLAIQSSTSDTNQMGSTETAPSSSSSSSSSPSNESVVQNKHSRKKIPLKSVPTSSISSSSPSISTTFEKELTVNSPPLSPLSLSPSISPSFPPSLFYPYSSLCTSESSLLSLLSQHPPSIRHQQSDVWINSDEYLSSSSSSSMRPPPSDLTTENNSFPSSSPAKRSRPSNNPSSSSSSETTSTISSSSETPPSDHHQPSDSVDSVLIDSGVLMSLLTNDVKHSVLASRLFAAFTQACSSWPTTFNGDGCILPPEAVLRCRFWSALMDLERSGVIILHNPTMASAPKSRSLSSVDQSPDKMREVSSGEADLRIQRTIFSLLSDQPRETCTSPPPLL